MALPDVSTVTVRVKKNSTTDQVYQVSAFPPGIALPAWNFHPLTSIFLLSRLDFALFPPGFPPLLEDFRDKFLAQVIPWIPHGSIRFVDFRE